MNKIVIRQGDEFRAKIETELEQGTFFEETCKVAQRNVQELTGEIGQKHSDSHSRSLAWRRSNNIIVFCGGRGQGKTSAMQTFAHRLKISDSSCYYVLDTIDPSSLKEDESIVRVLISLLFNNATLTIQNYIENNSKETDMDRMRRDRDSLMTLFEECFRNVDYSIKDHKNHFGMDDLELLSQMGSSTNLHEKLQQLIGEFLKFQTNYCDGKCQYEFLVIQIDDADLALNGILKNCEDIRNYFSLPNVIVLMAADMEQLTNSLLQEYLAKSRDLLAVDEKVGKKYYLECCIKMANRYVEKMFPVTHRVGLPNIQSVSKWNFKNITLQYIDEQGQDFFDHPQSIFCDMQKQLLQKLYERTGIIFFDTEQSIHPFLPKTMRELTHFVKMLYNMPKIDFKKAYMEDSEDRNCLKDNLDTIEDYFFDHWCPNNLKEDSQIASKATRERLFGAEPDVLNLLQEHSFDISSYESTDIILYTIYLNKKFMDIAENEKMTAYFAPFWEIWSETVSRETGFHILEYGLTGRAVDLGKFIFYNASNRRVQNFSIGNAIFNFTPKHKENLLPSGQKLLVYSNNEIFHLIAGKNIFANLEVYIYVTKSIQNACKVLGKSGFGTLKNVYSKIFSCLDMPKDKLQYLDAANAAVVPSATPKTESGGEDGVSEKDGGYKEDVTRMGAYLQTAYENEADEYAESFWENYYNKRQIEAVSRVLSGGLIDRMDIIQREVEEKLNAAQADPSKSTIVPMPNTVQDFDALIDSYDSQIKSVAEISNFKRRTEKLKTAIGAYNDSITKTDEITEQKFKKLIDNIRKSL